MQPRTLHGHDRELDVWRNTKYGTAANQKFHILTSQPSRSKPGTRLTVDQEYPCPHFAQTLICFTPLWNILGRYPLKYHFKRIFNNYDIDEHNCFNWLNSFLSLSKHFLTCSLSWWIHVKWPSSNWAALSQYSRFTQRAKMAAPRSNQPCPNRTPPHKQWSDNENVRKSGNISILTLLLSFKTT